MEHQNYYFDTLTSVSFKQASWTSTITNIKHSIFLNNTAICLFINGTYKYYIINDIYVVHFEQTTFPIFYGFETTLHIEQDAHINAIVVKKSNNSVAFDGSLIQGVYNVSHACFGKCELENNTIKHHIDDLYYIIRYF